MNDMLSFPKEFAWQLTLYADRYCAESGDIVLPVGIRRVGERGTLCLTLPLPEDSECLQRVEADVCCERPQWVNNGRCVCANIGRVSLSRNSSPQKDAAGEGHEQGPDGKSRYAVARMT